MHKISTFFRNLRLRAKFTLILLIAAALISTTAIATLHIPLRAYDEQLYKSSSQMVSLFAEQIRNELQDFEDISYRILTDNALQESLSTMKDSSPGTLNWVEAQGKMEGQVAYYSLWFSNAYSFIIKTARGVYRNYFFGTSVGAHELTEERVQAAHDGKGRAVWLTEDGERTRLILVREIREMRNLSLEPLGSILIEVNFPALVEHCSAGMAQLGLPPICAIYDKGVCLYASNDSIRNLDESEDGYTYMKIDGKEMLCVRYTSTNGMKYVTLVDYSQILAPTFAASCITIVSIIVATILVLFGSERIISYILKHLQTLLVRFDKFALSGKPVSLEDDPYKERADEIGDLYRRFDWMTCEWGRINREKEEQRMILHEKQIQQLRTQLQPHFLYNTLESIYCLAQNVSDNRIAVMTEALGKLLRASLNDIRDIVTVGEDLQITREYLRIQLIRYGDRLHVEYDVAEDVMSCRIPSMTIQPLVENAIHHAIEKMMDASVIRISGRIEAAGIIIIVEDDGPGMDEDILVKLESGEIKPEGMGIGMRNIHKRVQYAFSDQYGLSVRSNKGKTQVIVHLPDTR